MAGSIAEERLREKVVSALRERKPDARIIHELVLQQGGTRIDVAAVWPSGLILVEIKSERDTLSRLQHQLRASIDIGAETWLCLAEKWRPQIEALSVRTINSRREPIMIGDREAGYTLRSDPAPGYLPEIHKVEVRFETVDGLEALKMHPSWYLRPRRYNPYTLLSLLWADELKRVTGLGARATRDACIDRAADTLTGTQVREAVCKALRARSFPRADPAVEWST